MRQHLRDYWIVWLGIGVIGAVIALAVVMAGREDDRMTQECIAAGGTELFYEVDSRGDIGSVWCLDANGDTVNVPKWRNR